MIYTDPAEAAPAFQQRLSAAKRILLLTHINPDGDAIGSQLGLFHTLRELGKQPIALASPPLPSYVLGLPGIEYVTTYSPGMALPEVDLVWLVDTAAIDRIGDISKDHATTLTERPLLIVDHHVTNSGGGQVNLIDPGSASCAELLFRLLRAMQLPVSPAAATCLLMGTYTDTQSFQTSATSSPSLRTAADLLDAGADQHAIVEAVYYAIPLSTIRLTAMALSTIQSEGGLVWATVSREMLAEAGANEDATDDTVKRMQQVEGMRACVLLRERADGTVKISLRSRPGIDVARVAGNWGGGGHTQAAGATLQMGLTEAVEVVLARLREVV